MTIPAETEIARVMHDTGMGRMQAINHLRQRATLRARLSPRYGR